MRATGPNSSNYARRPTALVRIIHAGSPARPFAMVARTAVVTLILVLAVARPALPANHSALRRAIAQTIRQLQSDASALARCRTCAAEGGPALVQDANDDARMLRALKTSDSREASAKRLALSGARGYATAGRRWIASGTSLQTAAAAAIDQAVIGDARGLVLRPPQFLTHLLPQPLRPNPAGPFKTTAAVAPTGLSDHLDHEPLGRLGVGADHASFRRRRARQRWHGPDRSPAGAMEG